MSRLSRLLRKALHPVLFLGTGAAWAQSSPPPQSPPRQQASQRNEAPQRERQRDQDRRAQERREEARRDADLRERGQGDRGGLPDSVRRVERQTGGEVLRAEPMQRDGREVYRLKVLTADGRVRVVQDDPDRPRDERAGAERPTGRQDRQQDETSKDSDEDPPQ